MASNEFMRTQVVKITPDMAANWLRMNMKEQRRLEQKTVERYARAMKAGDWMLTHQGIAFDRSGKLIDGQHRLNAIIRAGVPVRVRIDAYYDTPKSESKKKLRNMLAGLLFPTKKPDWDNIGKIICDALNGIAWKDDAQIVDGHVLKHYSEVPHTDVLIEEVQHEDH